MPRPDSKKRFVKRVNTFLNQKDKFTDKETRRVLKLLNDARDDIVLTLQTTPQTDWGMFSLNRIKGQIDTRIMDMERRLVPEIKKSVSSMFDYSLDKADELLQASGIETPLFYAGEDVLSASQTLTGELIKSVGKEASRRIGNTVAVGMAQNKSIGEVVQDIIKQAEMSYSNAERIARTEILRTQSLAQERRFQQIQELNPVYLKRWVWSHKPNGREGHNEAEVKYTADPIPFEQPFKVRPDFNSAYEFGQFPRDPSFSAKNSIHCGCIHLLVRPEDAGSLIGINT